MTKQEAEIARWVAGGCIHQRGSICDSCAWEYRNSIPLHDEEVKGRLLTESEDWVQTYEDAARQLDRELPAVRISL